MQKNRKNTHTTLSRVFLMIGALGLVFLAACNSPTPTATPPPPEATLIPTPLPPAPTAPPLTEPPTAVVPTEPPTAAPTTVVPPTEPPTVAPLPTITTASVPPTSAVVNPTVAAPTTEITATVEITSTPGTPVDRGALTGLILQSLRFDPTYPQTNVPLAFYATVENQTGNDQHYAVCVEVFRQGETERIGDSNCDVSTIVPGTTEVLAGTWTGSGIKECLPFRARAVIQQPGEAETRQVFTTAGGSELSVDFNVCPQ